MAPSDSATPESPLPAAHDRSSEGERARRLTAADFHPEVMRLFDAYVHGGIDRRGFLERAAKFAVGGATAAGLLDALQPRFAQAQQVPAKDARIEANYVELAAPKGYGKV